MGYYDNEFIDGLVENLETEGGEAYLSKFTESIAPLLRVNPILYKTFGVYWWAVKEAIQKYAAKPDDWFAGTYFDEWMKENAWHGDLFRTVLAGAYYHSGQMTVTSDHEWTDADGVDHDYTLFDENAGM
jgi:hypothetical protein